MPYLVLLALPFLLAGGLISLIWAGAWWVVDWLQTLRERKRARIERELDRTQVELRATILQLASELGADAHEARKALIRASYVAASDQSDRPDR